jgi:hypothetical protein
VTVLGRIARPFVLVGQKKAVAIAVRNASGRRRCIAEPASGAKATGSSQAFALPFRDGPDFLLQRFSELHHVADIPKNNRLVLDVERYLGSPPRRGHHWLFQAVRETELIHDIMP